MKKAYVVRFTNSLGQRKIYSAKTWKYKKSAQKFIKSETSLRKMWGYPFKNPRIGIVKY